MRRSRLLLGYLTSVLFLVLMILSLVDRAWFGALGFGVAFVAMSIHVGQTLLATVRAPVQAAPVAPPAPERLEEIRRVLAGGDKIQAIKMYRDDTGAGLKEARDAVEGLGESST